MQLIVGIHPKGDKVIKFLSKITLEKGLMIGFLFSVIGIGLTIYAMVLWKIRGWGNLDPVKIMPITIPAVYLIIMGVQIAFASFFLGVLNIEYKIEK